MSANLTSKINFKRLANVPPATKSLLAILTISSGLLRILETKTYNQLLTGGEQDIDTQKIIIPYLQLIPNHTLYYPWTVITAIFIDQTIIRYILSFVILLFAGKFMERSWSSKELFRFVLIVGSISNLLLSVLLIFLNILHPSVEFFNVTVDGNFSILVGFLVAFKQLIPEHSLVIVKDTISLRVKHIPFIVLVIVSIISVLTFSTYPALQSWVGFYVAWVYLRFFQSNIVDPVLPQPNDVIGVKKLKGDASATFSLVHFFPYILQPILSPIFEQFYELVIQLGVLNRFNDSDIEQGNLVADRRLTGHNSISKSSQDSRNTAERRRQVALKVLEERIGEDLNKKEPETKT